MSNSKEESIRALYRTMVEAMNDPSGYSWLISKCGSQAAIAAIERKTIGVHAMTLNTFKKHSDIALEGGFEQIDKLRVALKKKSQGAKRNTANKTKSRISDCKKKLDEAERLRAILIRAYADLNRICIDAINKAPEYQYDLDKHNELYRDYFSLKVVANNE